MFRSSKGFCLLLLSALSAFGQTLFSWPELKADLEKHAANGFSLNSLRESSLLSQLIDRRDVRVFLEMANKRDDTITVSAGFLCLQQYFPEQALATGFQIILDAKSPGSPVFGEVLSYLKENSHGTRFNLAFTSVVARVAPDQHSSFAVILATIPPRELYKFFHKAPHTTMSATAESYILDRLFADAEATNKRTSIEMRTALNGLRLIPGEPRIIYALYAKDSSELREALRSILSDLTIPPITLRLIVHKRLSEIRTALPMLNLPENRQAIIEKMLETETK